MTVVVQSYGAFRAEDLLAPGMPEKFVEIIEGELVTTNPANPHHNRICYRIECLFDDFRRDKAGVDFGGSNDGFLLKKNPDTLLSPDASLYRTRPEIEGTWLEFAPEIAVDVLSPGNTPSEIAYKIRTYLAAGSEQVWIVDPRRGLSSSSSAMAAESVWRVPRSSNARASRKVWRSTSRRSWRGSEGADLSSPGI